MAEMISLSSYQAMVLFSHQVERVVFVAYGSHANFFLSLSPRVCLSCV